MYNPSFKSDIFYSVQNEDYQTELAVLRRIHRQRPLRVLLVASAGENALSLLTQDIVASVDAVDINPAQLHLCELRRTALEHLTRDEQLRLLGADPSTSRTEGEAERLALYEQLRPHLPDPARAFWDARRNQEIAFGLHHVGRNDIGMHDIQAGLRAAGFESLLHSPQDEDLPAWRAVYGPVRRAGCTGAAMPQPWRRFIGPHRHRQRHDCRSDRPAHADRSRLQC
jgi:S-adenosylmethionine-diacylglycerol 3-amino-3-carboxypropyl transferase